MRRRRAKYTWFPMGFTQGQIEREESKVIGDAITIGRISGDPDISTLVVPITFDAPRDPSTDNILSPGVLSDHINGDYIIKRILGHLWVCVTPVVQTDNQAHCDRVITASAGFFVARANEEQSGGGIGTPIGSATGAERVTNYSTLHPDTVREPWMWRRSWLLTTQRYDHQFLGQPGAEPGFAGAGGSVIRSIGQGLPASNIYYGSALDGPRVDIKSARRVRNDERLWLSVSVFARDRLTPGSFNGLPTGATLESNQQYGVVFFWEGRLLGALRKAHNRSNF